MHVICSNCIKGVDQELKMKFLIDIWKKKKELRADQTDKLDQDYKLPKESLLDCTAGAPPPDHILD